MYGSAGITAGTAMPMYGPPISPTDPEGVRQELERVLASPGFLRNERMCRFLRFLAERHLEGTTRKFHGGYTRPSFTRCLPAIAFLCSVGIAVRKKHRARPVLRPFPDSCILPDRSILPQISPRGRLVSDATGGNIYLGMTNGVHKFRVGTNGVAYADGGFQSSGADFAESFAVRGRRSQYQPGCTRDRPEH